VISEILKLQKAVIAEMTLKITQSRHMAPVLEGICYDLGEI